MEGRQRPPKATHPFPDHPNLKLFWANRRTVTGLIKTCTAGVAVYGTIMGLVYIFTKDNPRIYNIRLSTKEEVKSRLEKINAASRIKGQVPLTLEFNYDKIAPIKFNAGLYPEHNNLKFDDGIEFRPNRVNEVFEGPLKT